MAIPAEGSALSNSLPDAARRGKHLRHGSWYCFKPSAIQQPSALRPCCSETCLVFYVPWASQVFSRAHSGNQAGIIPVGPPSPSIRTAIINAEYRAFRVFQRTRLSGERPAPLFSSSCMLNIMTAVPANSCTTRRIRTGRLAQHKALQSLLAYRLDEQVEQPQAACTQAMWMKSSPLSS